MKPRHLWITLPTGTLKSTKLSSVERGLYVATCSRLAKAQAERGGYYYLEGAHDAEIWKDPKHVDLFENQSKSTLRDMCFDGLCDTVKRHKLPLQRTSRVATNNSYFAASFSQKCNGKHPCDNSQHLEDIRVSDQYWSPEYPKQYCQRIKTLWKHRRSTGIHNLFAALPTELDTANFQCETCGLDQFHKGCVHCEEDLLSQEPDAACPASRVSEVLRSSR